MMDHIDFEMGQGKYGPDPEQQRLADEEAEYLDWLDSQHLASVQAEREAA